MKLYSSIKTIITPYIRIISNQEFQETVLLIIRYNIEPIVLILINVTISVISINLKDAPWKREMTLHEVCKIRKAFFCTNVFFAPHKY